MALNAVSKMPNALVKVDGKYVAAENRHGVLVDSDSRLPLIDRVSLQASHEAVKLEEQIQAAKQVAYRKRELARKFDEFMRQTEELEPDKRESARSALRAQAKREFAKLREEVGDPAKELLENEAFSAHLVPCPRRGLVADKLLKGGESFTLEESKQLSRFGSYFARLADFDTLRELERVVPGTFSAHDYECFTTCLDRGDLNTFMRELDLLSELDQQRLIGRNNFAFLSSLSRLGGEEVLRSILGRLSQSQLNGYFSCEPSGGRFRSAAAQGNTPLIRLAFEKLSPAKIKEVLFYGNGKAFRKACEGGHLETVQEILEKASVLTTAKGQNVALKLVRRGGHALLKRASLKGGPEMVELIGSYFSRKKRPSKTAPQNTAPAPVTKAGSAKDVTLQGAEVEPPKRESPPVHPPHPALNMESYVQLLALP